MVDKKIHTEILLELLLKASSYNTEELILQQCLPMYLRKLNCFSASIIKVNKRICSDVFHMPIAAKKGEDWLEVKNYFAFTNPVKVNSVNEYGTKTGFYYGFKMDAYGVLVLGRKKAFSKSIIYDLNPVICQLGKQLIQAKKNIEREASELALKESERRLQLSLEVNRASVFENNFETGTSDSSPDLYHYLGYQSSEIPKTVEGVTHLIHPDDLDSVMKAFQQHVDGDVDIYYAEFRMRKKNGDWNWVDGQGKIIQRKPNGEPIMLLGISQDISSRKLVEAQLVKAKERAETSDKLKSAFLANMSHEIRTPMNGILGFADLLKQPQLDGNEQKEYIGIIERSGLRLLSIINDLVDISKVESGQMEIKFEDTKIIRQLKYIYEFFKPEALEKGLELTLRIPQLNGEVVLCTDREKLYAILTNLVKNAIKYTKQGVIEMGYHETDRNIQFFVSDTGVGIDEDLQESVFNRFVQIENTQALINQGSGLGLSIAKAYVEMLGGRIWFESTLNSGTTFYFILPKTLNPKI